MNDSSKIQRLGGRTTYSLAGYVVATTLRYSIRWLAVRRRMASNRSHGYATCLTSCLTTAAAKHSPRHLPVSRSPARNWTHCFRTVGCSRTPIMLGQWIRFAAKSGKPRKKPAAVTDAVNPRSSPNAHFAVAFGGELEGGAFGLLAVAFLIREWAFGFPQLILHPQNHSSQTKKESGEFGELVGQIGIATSPLRPSGDADIGGVKYSVVSYDGAMIDLGSSVVVRTIRNGGLCVAPVAEASTVGEP